MNTTNLSLARVFASLLAIVLVTQSAASVASAQDEPERITRARAAYDQGADAFSRGRFQEALDRFSEAYELSSRSELLYNLGTAHDRLGNKENAVEHYRAYLEAVPDAANGEYTTSRITVLEREIAEEAASESAREQAEAEAAAAAAREEAARREAEEAERLAQQTQLREEESGGPDVGGIALLATAGAVGVAAVVTGVMALGQRSDLEDACPDMRCSPDQQGDLDRLGALTITTDVLIGVAAAAAVTGVVFFIVGGEDDEETASLRCGPTGCTARMRF